MSVYRGSRYANTFRRTRGNRPYLTTPQRVDFTPSLCTTHQVTDGETIDGLAYKYYGNAAYWWCIMDANREYQSELEIKAGDILQIPAWDEVRRVV